jgi:2-keto-3-deoxy-L-fuconate dehydrogenase
MRLKDKTAFCTASGAGIGLATVRAFRAEGARVIATDRDAGAVKALAAEGFDARVLDVTDAAAVQAIADQVGAVDILFNCAGFVHHGTILDCDEAAFDASFDLNVKAMFRVTRAFLPGMLGLGAGSIVNIASVVSATIAAPNRFIYGTTKAAVVGMTKSIAADYIRRGIRANAICPGTVDTPSLHDRMRAMGDYDTARDSFLARQPTGKLATAEEIAPLAVYLASDESGFVTGQALAIDGGWTNT